MSVRKAQQYQPGASKYYVGELIRLSVKRRAVCQTRRMISFTSCIEKAEMCDAQARASVDTSLAATWLEMALHWRSLADDGSDQATLARLMSARRQPRG